MDPKKKAWEDYEAGRITRQEFNRIMGQRSAGRTQQGQGMTWQHAKAQLLLVESKDTLSAMQETQRAGRLTPRVARLMQAHIARNDARMESLQNGGPDNAEGHSDYREVR